MKIDKELEKLNKMENNGEITFDEYLEKRDNIYGKYEKYRYLKMKILVLSLVFAEALVGAWIINSKKFQDRYSKKFISDLEFKTNTEINIDDEKTKKKILFLTERK